MPRNGIAHRLAALICLCGLIFAQPGVGIVFALALHGGGHTHNAAISWQEDGVQLTVNHCHHHGHQQDTSAVDEPDTCPPHVFHVCAPSTPATLSAKASSLPTRLLVSVPVAPMVTAGTLTSFSFNDYRRTKTTVEPWRSRQGAARSLRSVVLVI